MVDSTFDLTISLIIKSSNSLEHISTVLGISPTSYRNREQSQFGFIESDKNIWVYSKKYRNYDGNISIQISNFLDDIPNYSFGITFARQHAECTIRISIISDWAQNAFSLESKELEVIRNLDVPLEVSIFSWGNCVSE